MYSQNNSPGTLEYFHVSSIDRNNSAYFLSQYNYKNKLQLVSNFSGYDSLSEIKKSPGGAALRSAILPGFGQFYNESYWKIPIIYGIGAFFIYEYLSYDKDFKDYEIKFNASVTEVNPYGNYYLKSYREYYRDLRDSFIWYMGLLYLLNIVDAYVDAHLFDFNVNNYSNIRISSSVSIIRLKIDF